MPQLPFTFRDHVRKAPDPDPSTAGDEAPPSPAQSESPAPETPTIFSVSQLQRRLCTQLERAYPEVWVAGEVSNFGINSRSGHAYFTLKDKQASLQVVMFEDHARRLRFRPKDGLEVLARGKITVWAKGGRMQLSAVHLEPRGVGALQQAFEELVEKLRAEGLTAPERKRPRPAFPRTVGVVTSRGSAAMRDVLRTLLRRDPQAHVRFAFCPVQGKSAAFHIVRAIERLDHAGCDVLLVARGGGSAEDLWAFNEEPVARALVATRAPVITGVGHETDTTAADLVADLRASTPTAAAELAVPVRAEIDEGLRLLQLRLQRAARAQWAVHRRRFDAAELRLPRADSLLVGGQQTLDDLDRRAERAVRGAPRTAQARLRPLEQRLEQARPQARLAQQSRRLEALTARLERGPAQVARARGRLEVLDDRRARAFGPRAVQARRARLEALEARLEGAARRRLAGLEARFTSAVGRIEALSPLAVLARGYAIATDADGRVLKDAARARPGDPITVRLARGEVRAEVRATEGDDRG